MDKIEELEEKGQGSKQSANEREVDGEIRGSFQFPKQNSITTENNYTPQKGESIEDEQQSAWIVGTDSDLRPLLSVVMPTMNEEEGIRECIERIKQAVIEIEVPTEIVISDDSTDRTPEIARELGAIVVKPGKEGYGYAYRFAFEQTRGEYVVMGDADTTYDFQEIPRLLEHLQETGADIVMGSRLEGEIKPGAMPLLHKYVGNPLLTRFLNVFYDAGVSDAHSGFRIFKRDVLDKLDLESDGMEFASEMVMRAGANDLTIEEVPITYHERKGEATLESFRDGWRHVRFMLLNAPGYLFSIPAIAFGLIGVPMLILSLLGAEFSGVLFGDETAIIGSFLSILGFQIGTLSIFSSVATKVVRSPDDILTRWVRQNIRLEHGIVVGIVLISSGILASSVVAYQTLSTGSSFGLSLVPHLISFTAIFIGIQAIFSSFFYSMVARTSEEENVSSSSEIIMPFQ